MLITKASKEVFLLYIFVCANVKCSFKILEKIEVALVKMRIGKEIKMENFKKLIGEDVFKTHIEPKLGADKKYFFGEGDFIPKGRFDEINEQLKGYKTQIEDRDKQLQSLSEKAKGNEELTKQIEELRTNNQKQVEEFQKKLQAQEYDFSYKSVLNSVGAKDIKILDALIDKEKVVYKDGQFSGLNEQIEALRKTHDYVFNQAPNPTPPRIGSPIGGTPPTPGSPNPIDQTQQRSWNKHKRYI